MRSDGLSSPKDIEAFESRQNIKLLMTAGETNDVVLLRIGNFRVEK
jgi:hypothetical protein